MLLEVNGLTKNFGGLSAVSNVSMKVPSNPPGRKIMIKINATA